MRKLICLLFFSSILVACSPNRPASSAPGLETMVVQELTRLALESPTLQPATPTPASTPIAPSPVPDGGFHPGPVVAYIHQGQIWLADRSGATRQLTSQAEPVQALRIRADARQIAFLRGGELFALDVLSGAESLWISKEDTFKLHPSASIRNFDFVPGQPGLVFDLFYDDQGLAARDFHRVEPGSRQVQTLLAEGQGGERWFFSPDGNAVAFSNRDNIRVLHFSNHQVASVLEFKPASHPSYLPTIQWLENAPAPGGFYTIILPNTQAGTARYYYVPMGGKPAMLAQFKGLFSEGASLPQIAPNGTAFAYLKQASKKSQVEIHVMDVSTADRMYVAGENLQLYGWAGLPPVPLYGVDDALWYLKDGTPERFLSAKNPDSFFLFKLPEAISAVYLDGTVLYWIDINQGLIFKQEDVTAFVTSPGR